MTVRFLCGDSVDVEYDFGDARVPCAGELIYPDGTDPKFAKGAYRVQWVEWEINVRGPRAATCYLSVRS